MRHRDTPGRRWTRMLQLTEAQELWLKNVASYPRIGLDVGDLPELRVLRRRKLVERKVNWCITPRGRAVLRLRDELMRFERGELDK